MNATQRVVSGMPDGTVAVPSDPQHRAALADWEDDGGGGVATRRSGHDEAAPWPPLLPAGYTAQPVRGFHDSSGRRLYEFYRVYGPPVRRDHRGAISRQDEDRSYWSVTWSVTDRAGERHQKGWSITLAQARALDGSRMTFDRFFALRAALPALLERESKR